jgi:hypothetical protein
MSYKEIPSHGTLLIQLYKDNINIPKYKNDIEKYFLEKDSESFCVTYAGIKLDNFKRVFGISIMMAYSNLSEPMCKFIQNFKKHFESYANNVDSIDVMYVSYIDEKDRV